MRPTYRLVLMASCLTSLSVCSGKGEDSGGVDFRGQQHKVVGGIEYGAGEQLCELVWDVEGVYSDACPWCDFTLDLTYTYNSDESWIADDACVPGEDFSQTLGYYPDYTYRGAWANVMMYEYYGRWYSAFIAGVWEGELSWYYYGYTNPDDPYYATYYVEVSGKLR